jgi:hypothetical protein
VITKTALAIVMAGLIAFAAGCDTDTMPGAAAGSAEGKITGTATPCVGATSVRALRRIPVRVTLSEGSRTVADESGRGSVHYVFSESPGQYRLSSDQSATTPRIVVVHAGVTSRVDLVSSCK